MSRGAFKGSTQIDRKYTCTQAGRQNGGSIASREECKIIHYRTRPVHDSNPVLNMELVEDIAIKKDRRHSAAEEYSESDSVDDKESVTRETWNHQFEFLLSVVGYTVGIGSIWRFPYLCYRNGGGAFFIPFLIFLVIWGGPMYYMELCLGQFSGKSAMQMFDFCPIMRGIGIVMVAASALCVAGYGVAFSWIVYYLFQSFYPTLGWTTCDNDWNTPNCIDNRNLAVRTNTTSNVTYAVNTTVRGTTPANEFWVHKVLGQSEGIHEFGRIQWHIVVSLFVTWLLVFLCLVKGIKSLGKVVYVTVLGPYILLLVLLVRGLTLDGGLDGVRLYLYPDFSRLLQPQIWVEAALQVFYSLGPGWGTIITMASFNKFNDKALRNSIIVCAADLVTAFLCGLVVFSMVGVLSKITGDPIDKLPFAGPGLAFVAYPEALARLPFPQVWSVMFFLTLVFIGIDTTFGMTETVSNAIVDTNYQRLSRYRTHITLLVTMSLFLIGVAFCFSNGVYVFQLTDWYVATFNITVATLLECVCVAWIYGVNRFSLDIEMMTGSKPSTFLRLCWVVVEPLYLMGLVVLAILYYSPPNGQNGYVFPFAAVAIGNVMALAPLVAIPGYAIYDLRHRHGSFMTRIKNAFKASAEWQPKDKGCKMTYLEHPYRYETNFQDRVLVDMLGVKSKSG